MTDKNTPQRLGRVVDIPDGQVRAYALPDNGDEPEVLVVRRGDVCHAYLNRCPHTGVPLNWYPDQFLNREGDLLQCATHGALFRIEDGECLHGPCRGRRLHSIALHQDEDGWLVLPT